MYYYFFGNVGFDRKVWFELSRITKFLLTLDVNISFFYCATLKTTKKKQSKTNRKQAQKIKKNIAVVIRSSTGHYHMIRLNSV